MSIVHAYTLSFETNLNSNSYNNILGPASISHFQLKPAEHTDKISTYNVSEKQYLLFTQQHDISILKYKTNDWFQT